MPNHPEDPPGTSRARALRIKVIGIGGGGISALSYMFDVGIAATQFIAIDTDLQTLDLSQAPVKLLIGTSLVGERGTSGDAAIGRRAALEDSLKIIHALAGADLVFVIAGLGGGTGTGAAPFVASLAREMGALAIAAVTLPFVSEGRPRTALARKGTAELVKTADTLLVIRNDAAHLQKTPETAANGSRIEPSRATDQMLLNAVRSICGVVTVPGAAARGFADAKAVLAGMGYASMASVSRTGPDRAISAAAAALASPMLEPGAIDRARGILVHISGPASLTLREVNEATARIRETAGEDANLIFVAVPDDRPAEHLADEVRVTVIAAGLQHPPIDHLHHQPQDQPGDEAVDHNEMPPSDETAPAINLDEFRTLLAELSREFAESDNEFLSEGIEPMPLSRAQPSSAHRTAITAYAAAAAINLPEPAPVATSNSFAWILEDSLGRVEAAASHAEIAEPSPIDDPPTQRTQPDSAFGQRFRARRRTLGRGCTVR